MHWLALMSVTSAGACEECFEHARQLGRLILMHHVAGIRDRMLGEIAECRAPLLEIGRIAAQPFVQPLTIAPHPKYRRTDTLPARERLFQPVQDGIDHLVRGIAAQYNRSVGGLLGPMRSEEACALRREPRIVLTQARFHFP